MTYDVNTPIKGRSVTSRSQWIAWTKANAGQNPLDAAQYVSTMVNLCQSIGFNSDVLIVQSIHETTEGGKPWNSYYWKERLNPAGIGITGDPDQNAASKVFKSGVDAAQAQWAHMYGYVLGKPGSGGDAQKFKAEFAADPRWSALVGSGWLKTVTTLNDLTNKWAVDDGYAQKIADRMNHIIPLVQREPTVEVELPDIPVTQPEAPTVATYTTTVIGLPGGPLVTDYPINTKNLLGYSEKQNPQIKAKTPRYSVQHGTGNPNSMASGENRWLVDNRGDDQWVSFHFVADDTGVYQNLDVSYISYQAADGDGPGNMNGYSCEMIENADLWADTARSLRVVHVCGDLMGRIAARYGTVKPQQHWDFNYALPASQRHDCPDKLRHKKINGELGWDIYVREWNAAKADELKRMGGTTTPTAPAKPADIGFQADLGKKAYFVDGDSVWFNGTTRYTANKDTPGLVYAVAGSGVLKQYKKGDTVVEVAHGTSKTDGKQYILTAARERVLMDDLTPIATKE